MGTGPIIEGGAGQGGWPADGKAVFRGCRGSNEHLEEEAEGGGGLVVEAGWPADGEAAQERRRPGGARSSVGDDWRRECAMCRCRPAYGVNRRPRN